MFFGRKGLILGRAENSARIAGKRLCDDARLRAFAAVGGLRPGIHAGYPWTNATARGPLTGLLAGTALSLPIPLAEPLERVAQGEETA